MKRLILFILLFSLFNITLVEANDSTCIYFFYGEGCQHCAKIEPIIENLIEQSDNLIEFHKFEIYNNRSNMKLLSDYFNFYNIQNSKRGVPIVLIGKEYLIGNLEIEEDLKNLIEKNKNLPCPNLEKENSENNLSSLSILTIIGAALVDSINPCAIAVLLILMSALLVTNNKNKAVKAGLAFTLSIYIAYFLFGLGLFSVIKISGVSYLFYRTIGILAIIIGLANIKDFFWYGGGGFVMEIPRTWRPKLKEMLEKVTSPFGAFLIGFIVCLFELPCTGGPYIVILGLLADKSTMIESIPLLLMYNLIFILPLLIITFLIYSEFSNIEKTTKWKDCNLRNLHLIAGIIMLILGILISFKLI